VVVTVEPFLSQEPLFLWVSSELVCSDSLSGHAAVSPTSYFPQGSNSTTSCTLQGAVWGGFCLYKALCLRLQTVYGTLRLT
jgi:hypothetical protein